MQCAGSGLSNPFGFNDLPGESRVGYKEGGGYGAGAQAQHAKTVRSHIVQPAKRLHDSERMNDLEHVKEEEEQQSLSHTTQSDDDGPEFSSEPMPAAFSACLFLGLALVIGALLLMLW